jgi:hypothetical protein
MTNNSLLKGRNFTARQCATEHIDNWGNLLISNTMTDIFHSVILGGEKGVMVYQLS